MTALLPLCALYLFHIAPACWAYPVQALVVSLLLVATVFAVRLPGRRTVARVVSLLLCTYLLVGRGAVKSTPSYAFEEGRITHLEGTLVEDSTLSRSENQVLRVQVHCCGTEEGDEGGSRGIVSALVSLPDPLYAATEVTLEGSFSPASSLFIADHTTVQRIPAFALLRRRLISRLNERVVTLLGQGAAKSLSTMLLLGQSDSESFVLKDLAVACGCAHTLALSGMHLSFFLNLSTLLFSLLLGRRWGRRVGMVPPVLFVLLAGPKPSLVRALLFRFAIFLPIRPGAASNGAFLFQLAFFPEILTSLSALYSWAAFAALLFSSRLPRFPLRTTAMAIAATAPASLLYTGSWNAMGLLLSTPVTLLIALSMALSLALLVFGPLAVKPLMWVCNLLLTLLAWGAAHPQELGKTAYLCYLLLLLTTVIAIGYAESMSKRQRRKRYEMGVRIRLTEGHRPALGRAGLCDDEEVWTELPAHHLHPGEDRQPAVAHGGLSGA